MKPNQNLENPACDDQLLETTLLQATAKGDSESFTQLCSLVEPLIFGTALRILNNPDDAKDVAQDVLLQIWKKAGVYRPDLGKPRTWIGVLARNRSIDRLRGSQRRAAALEHAGPELCSGLSNPMDAGEETLVAERHQIIRDAVMELPADQREAIYLAYYAGLTQTSIAERTQTPLGTVKSRIRYGIRKLHNAAANRL